MAIPKSAINVSSIFLGVCIPSLKHNASKFRVRYLYFDEFLKMYFTKNFEVLAEDSQKICKSGDVALIQELPDTKYKQIKHKVIEVVYPCGEIIDPITGKKVINGKYRDMLSIEEALYGKSNCKFKYEEAPARGWQENKKDFSNRPTFRKYSIFGEDKKNDSLFSTE